ncbi:NapC/NirT family cytochrome c [Aestuariirhabdus sp. LZHN29]|uniref:NapC/NirT family cytochrome c n=1 Tax=Aestuariirhabdus sp. LZHN29 TaxID=3417462 RepID=UPI003CE8A76E
MWQSLFAFIKKWCTLPIIAAFVIGIGLTISTNAFISYSNSEAFCISCHEMRDNVYMEYQETIHDMNRTGNRTTCADCHVPREFFPKMIRKIKASKELWYMLTGKIDTPEKFEEHRYEMALNEWRRMKANDSAECRACHNVDAMDPSRQTEEAQDRHKRGFAEGKSCIDCHFAIAHFEPDGELSPEDL